MSYSILEINGTKISRRFFIKVLQKEIYDYLCDINNSAERQWIQRIRYSALTECLFLF